ncbi:malectin domain-containing carbohydrate-binding protein [Arthrobacter sp. MDT3-44]
MRKTTSTERTRARSVRRKRSLPLQAVLAAFLLALSGTAAATPAGAVDPQVVRVNAGGPAVTTGGVAWAADSYFSGGKTFTNPKVTSIAGTTDDALYLTERSASSALGGFSYSIPVTQSGSFTVKLHFAEIWHGATGGGPGGAGKRVFDVNVEGGAVELDNFDIYAQVGAMTATTRTFTSTVADGRVDIAFTAVIDQPQVSAIEITYPTGTTPPPPPGAVRVNAGGPAVTTGGVAWATDSYFSGGKTFTNPKVTSIAGTTDDALYLTERSASSALGGFSYSIPVTQSGSFTVKLHFAEIWHGATGGGPGGAGKRVFDVNVEGGAVELDNFDIYAQVGAMTATTRTFTSTVADGRVDIAFTAVIDQPQVSAIEITYPTDGTPIEPAPSIWPSSWTPAPTAPEAIFETAATTVGGKIYRFGGFNSKFEVFRTYSSFDPATSTWKALGAMPSAAAESHQGITNDGRYIYLAGGFAGNLDSSHTPTQAVNDRVWRYDPQANTWTAITRLPQPRGAGVLGYVNGELHYISGNPADRVTNVGDHFVYNLSTGAWRTAAPLPNPKDHMSSAEVGGKIYILGGEHGHDKYHEQQADAHVYDPATNTWSRLADLPRAKSHLEAATFVSSGQIVMAGGQIDDFQPMSQVSAFNPASNTWSMLTPLPQARQGAIVQRVGDRLVIALGGEQTHEPQDEVWIGTLP